MDEDFFDLRAFETDLIALSISKEAGVVDRTPVLADLQAAEEATAAFSCIGGVTTLIPSIQYNNISLLYNQSQSRFKIYNIIETSLSSSLTEIAIEN